jgi:hypothetical protein
LWGVSFAFLNPEKAWHDNFLIREVRSAVAKSQGCARHNVQKKKEVKKGEEKKEKEEDKKLNIISPATSG